MKKIKYNALSSLMFCLFMIAVSSASADNSQVIKNFISPTLSELHIIGVDVNSDKHLYWAAWCEESKQGTLINLALLSSTSSTEPNIILKKQDAYEPTITRIDNWKYKQHPILALTYQQGAAAKQIELYGLDNKDSPRLLDQRLGEEIHWRIDSDGKTLLSVYTKPKGKLKPTCYLWEEKTEAVIQKPCQD